MIQTTSDSDHPRVSVLLPTHDRPETLRHAIASLQAQTVQDFEILVVGDGCADPTRELMASIQDPRVRWFDLPKAPGFGYGNRNTALEEARGDFMAYMAHDDLAMPDHLERLLRYFEDPEVILAYSRPLWVDPQGHFFPSYFSLEDPVVLTRFLRREFNLMPACCVVYRLDATRRQLRWDDQLTKAGDWDLWIRILQSGSDKELQSVLRFHPFPTTFHFQADWRQARREAVPDSEAWAELQRQGRFPAQLQLAGAPELLQELVLHRLLEEGVSWIAEVREASVRAIDLRYGWVNEIAITQLERAERLRGELDRTKSQLKTLKESIKQNKPSHRRWWPF